MNEKRPCPQCATPIGADFKACPHCGQSFAPPPPPSSPAPAAQEEEHLRLLSIFHYVVAAILALFASFPLIHLVVGLVMLVAPEAMGEGRQAPPRFVGLVIVLFAGIAILVGWSLAGAIAYAGRCLARRRRHTLCMVAAAVSCMFMPFGTLLGVFTLITLNKPSVKALFETAAPPVSHPG